MKLSLNLGLVARAPPAARITAITLNPGASTIVTQAQGHPAAGLEAQLDMTYNAGPPHQGRIREVVNSTTATGCFAGVHHDTGGGVALVADAYADPHTTPLCVVANGPGVSVLDQYFEASETTGADWWVVANSGYRITRTVTQTGDNMLRIVTHQTGAAVTIGSRTVAAGAGTVTVTQDILFIRIPVVAGLTISIPIRVGATKT